MKVWPLRRLISLTDSAQDATAPVDDGQLKIVTPQDESEADAQDDAEAGKETVTTEEAGAPQQDPSVVSAAQENLENDVLIAQEKIDRLERENTDLNDKLKFCSGTAGSSKSPAGASISADGHPPDRVEP